MVVQCEIETIGNPQLRMHAMQREILGQKEQFTFEPYLSKCSHEMKF